MHFAKSDTIRAPFGKNVYWRSTQDLKYESATFGKALIPAETIDGDSLKVAQSGTVVARATSGADIGKIGVYQPTTPTDGRQLTASIVGVLDTFMPWELNERDHNCAFCYEGTLVQAWCFEYNAAGQRIALTNATRDAILALPNVELKFK